MHTARALAYAPHVAQLVTATRGSQIDHRTTRHPGYAESQRRRKLVEESFGWGKVVGLLRKLRHRGVALVDAVFTFTMGIYNLVRIRTLTEAGVCTSGRRANTYATPALDSRRPTAAREDTSSQFRHFSAAC